LVKNDIIYKDWRPLLTENGNVFLVPPLFAYNKCLGNLDLYFQV